MIFLNFLGIRLWMLLLICHWSVKCRGRIILATSLEDWKSGSMAGQQVLSSMSTEPGYMNYKTTSNTNRNIQTSSEIFETTTTKGDEKTQTSATTDITKASITTVRRGSESTSSLHFMQTSSEISETMTTKGERKTQGNSITATEITKSSITTVGKGSESTNSLYSTDTTSSLTENTTDVDKSTSDVVKKPMPTESPEEALIGGVVGGAVVLVVMIFLITIVIIRRRKSLQLPVSSPSQGSQAYSTSVYNSNFDVSVRFQSHPLPPIPKTNDESNSSPLTTPPSPVLATGHQYVKPLIPTELPPESNSFPPIRCEQVVEKYKNSMKHNHEPLKQEFKVLESCPVSGTTVESDREENKGKDRYDQFKTYDHSRVVLSKIQGTPGSDYINANFVQDYSKKTKFIAAQAPLESTIDDFWRMVWEQNVSVIIMMVNLVQNGEERCSQYFPDSHKDSSPSYTQYGSITVELQHMVERADYKIRYMQISQNREYRVVTQFHYTSWQDDYVPTNCGSLLTFIGKITKHLQNESCTQNNKQPVIVHCSGGVGEAALYLVMDYMFEMVQRKKEVDMFGCVLKLRQERQGMIPFEHIYISTYRLLVEWLLFGYTEVRKADAPKHIAWLSQKEDGESVTRMEKEFKKVDTLVLDLLEGKEIVVGKEEANMDKNRYDFLIPYENNRVRISSCQDSTESYINASWIDGFHSKKAYIITQDPLSFTVGEFWRMISEHGVSDVVMLSELGEGQTKCYHYWPRQGSAVHDGITVTLESVEEYGDYTIRTFQVISDDKGHSSQQVHQFHYTAWPSDGVPKCATGLIDMIGQLKEHQRKAKCKPITVHCSGGGDRSSAFCAIMSLMEQLQAEGVVDVLQTAKLLKEQRQYMIPSMVEYAFIYKVLLEYIEISSDA